MITKVRFPTLLAIAVMLAAGTMPAVDAAAQDDPVEQPMAVEPSAPDEQPALDDPSVTEEQFSSEKQSATEDPATTEQEASTTSVMPEDSTADEQSIIVAKPKPVVDRSARRTVSVVQVPRATMSSRRGVMPKLLGSYR